MAEGQASRGKKGVIEQLFTETPGRIWNIAKMKYLPKSRDSTTVVSAAQAPIFLHLTKDMKLHEVAQQRNTTVWIIETEMWERTWDILVNELEELYLVLGPYLDKEITKKERGFYRYCTVTPESGALMKEWEKDQDDKSNEDESQASTELDRNLLDHVWLKVDFPVLEVISTAEYFHKRDGTRLSQAEYEKLGEKEKPLYEKRGKEKVQEKSEKYETRLYKVYIPPEQIIEYPGINLKKHLRLFGYSFVDFWKNTLYKGELISQIIADAKDIYSRQSEVIGEKGVENIMTRVYAWGEAYKKVIEAQMTRIGHHESDLRKINVNAANSFWMNQYEILASQLTARHKFKNSMVCQHTYRIFKTMDYKVGKEKKNLVDQGLLERWDHELSDGKDERNMPLEVEKDPNNGDIIILADKYKILLWENHRLRCERNGWDWGKEEAALKDVYFEKPPRVRKIPDPDDNIWDQCTWYGNLADMAFHIEGEFDSLRDNLRDGRFMKYSATIQDHILMDMNQPVPTPLKKDAAGNTVDDGGWESPKRHWLSQDASQDEIDRARSYRMMIMDHAWTGDTMRFSDHNRVPHRGTRRPSNLNPAFDLRALKNHKWKDWKYPGRIFYYWSTDGIDCRIVHPDQDGHISSRGVAMYMIDQIVSRTVDINRAEEILRHLARETQGLDYGPREYGSRFHMDPSNIDIRPLNTEPREGDK